jgi:hypothetical protein
MAKSVQGRRRLEIGNCHGFSDTKEILIKFQCRVLVGKLMRVRYSFDVNVFLESGSLSSISALTFLQAKKAHLFPLESTATL